jgi:hypothetical protein
MDKTKWDIFISHAWEDKEQVARPLAQALINEGLKVWYDEMTLKLGDSLRRSIDRGLAESRYGIIILSPAFFNKQWTQYELDGLVTRDFAPDKVILPIWYQVGREEVARYSPSLAGRVAANWADGPEQVVAQVMAVVRPDTFEGLAKSGPSFSIQQKMAPIIGQESVTRPDTVHLYEQIMAVFSLEEMHDLCFHLGVAAEDIAGDTRSQFARNLVGYLQRRGRLADLVRLARQLRPHLDW